MLALNVSKETLDVIVKVDDGLRKTTDNFEAKNNQQYTSFENQLFLNKAKVGPWKDKADEVKLQSDDLYNKINQYKLEIVQRADGDDADLDSIRNLEDLNASAEIMLTADGGRRSDDLRNSFNSYRDFLLTLVVDADSSLTNSIRENLATPDPPRDEHSAGRTWQMDNFEDLPLIGVMALMSKMQSDVRNAESDVLNYLFSQISAQEFKFNDLRALAIPKSNYIFQGGTFEAEIILIAIDTTQEPQIFVNGAAQTVRDGKAVYSTRSNSLGYKTYNGYIRYTAPDGSVNNYEFNGEYEVAVPSLVVSPTKMNVFYMGIPNPVEIGVPNVLPENISAEMTNGRIVKTGDDFLVEPNKDFGTAEITVYAQIDGERRNMGTKEFRLKPLPTPTAKVADKIGGRIDKALLLLQVGVEAALEDFLFDLSYEVISFKVTSIKSNYADDESSNSWRFTSQQKDLIRALNRGDRLYIEDIKCTGPDGKVRDLQTISFIIN
jgi:gliding motility-associated protein GldM